jgi:predicted XRE-type DNA-binding protein
MSITSNEPIEVVVGSGNVFRDFDYPDADVRQAKAIMGAQIIKILDRERLSTRQAEATTGVSHSEFSRIRQASFGRFTIDRLMTILYRLGQQVEISVKVHPRKRAQPIAEATTAHP